jgi:hypothetical protein
MVTIDVSDFLSFFALIFALLACWIALGAREKARYAKDSAERSRQYVNEAVAKLRGT